MFPILFLTTFVSSRRRTSILVMLAFLALGGCVRPGAAPDWRTAPTDLPDIAAILQEVQATTAGLESFRASGRFLLDSPDLEAVQLLRQSTFSYRAPASMHVIGRKYSKAVFKLTADGDAYVIELPTEKQYYWSDAQGVGTPAAIAREMFFEAGWEALDAATVRVEAYDADAGTLRLAAPLSLEGRAFTRRLVLQGPPWRVAESVLEDARGQVVAQTTRSNYRSFEGVLLPTAIVCAFPLHETRMEFDISTLTLNPEYSAGLYDVDGALADLIRRNFAPLQQAHEKEMNE